MSNILLPIGSVIKLNGFDRPIMIYGVYQTSLQNGKTYDYIGEFYPEGFLGGESNLLFNSNMIAEVLFEGYKTPEYEKLMIAAEKRMEQEKEITEE